MGDIGDGPVAPKRTFYLQHRNTELESDNSDLKSENARLRSDKPTKGRRTGN